MNRYQKEENQPLIGNKSRKREASSLSLPMAWLIIILGYICNFGEMIYSGFCLMLLVCSYLWIPGMDFFSYYSSLCPTISFFHVYLLFLLAAIHATYGSFSIKATKILVAKILFLLATIFAVVAMILSLILVPYDQAIISMYRREPEWWRGDLTTTAFNTWHSDTYVPFAAMDIARGVVILLMALCFVFGFNISSDDFMVSFELN